MMSTMPQYRVFLNDLARDAVEVRYRQDGDRHIVEGLPLMRPGEWNGVPFTDADLRAMAANFGTVLDADQWQPAMKPRHTWKDDGSPADFDADEVQGRLLNLRVVDGLLVGDWEVYDEATIRAMQTGKLRYMSAEVAHDYVLADGTNIGPAIIGAAWVDYPAVRGMGWELVLNAQEFTRAEPPDRDNVPADPEVAPADNADDGAARDQTEGGTQPMSILDRVKATLAGKVAEEDLAVLDALQDEDEPEVKPEGDTPEEPEGDAEPQALAGQSSEILRLQQEAMQNRKAIAELTAKLTQQENTARAERVTAIVDGLAREGHLPPAMRAHAHALLSRIMPDEQIITLGEQAMLPHELFVEIMRGSGPSAVRNTPRGLTWQGTEDPDEADAAAEDAEAEKLAKFG
ncbi:MAG: phage protease [Candidatus Thermoplasmatota archaeon]|nr:phage protease [Candidatus Thermoplasmatota archaeon]